MYTEDKHCPICGSTDTTNISVMDFYGHARLHSFDLNISYICACMRCGVVFVPKCLLPNEGEENDEHRNI